MVKKFLWGAFAWGLGILFVLGGIYTMIWPMYPGRAPIFGIDYNVFVGFGGIIIGIFLIRAWFKQFKNNR